jgi:hypothetical protein
MSVRSSGPAGLRLRPVLLGCSNSLGTTASFSSLSKARVHYVPARPCQLIAVFCCLISHILAIPYVLSLVNYCYIRHASPPLGPIEGVRGIYPLTTIIPKRAGYVVCFRYLLCLGPS